MSFDFEDFKNEEINGVGIRTTTAFNSILAADNMQQQLDGLMGKLFSVNLRHVAACTAGPGTFGPAHAADEKALQRGIYRSENIRLPGNKKITWLDIEVPVEYYSAARRGGVDLIGYCEDDNSTYIVELKYSDTIQKHVDTPLFAALEVAHYGHALCDKVNKDHLLNQVKPSMFHENSVFRANNALYENLQEGKLFQKIVLVVAANNTYWKKWIINLHANEKVNSMRSIIEGFLKGKTNNVVGDLLFLDVGEVTAFLEGVRNPWTGVSFE